MERYLGGGFVKGVGPVLAKKLVGHFGAGVLKVIGDNPSYALAMRLLQRAPRIEKGAALEKALGKT